ncbi:hypothetical protein AB9F43_33285, partial [Rhizobium leguminosarum]
LKALRIGGTVRNLPPSSVYRISRRKPLELSRERIIYRGSATDIDDVAACLPSFPSACSQTFRLGIIVQPPVSLEKAA